MPRVTCNSMSKHYQKDPVVTETIQWNGTNVNEIKKFAGAYRCDVQNDRLYISTIEGTLSALNGEYILKDTQGKLHTCSTL